MNTLATAESFLRNYQSLMSPYTTNKVKFSLPLRACALTLLPIGFALKSVQTHISEKTKQREPIIIATNKQKTKQREPIINRHNDNNKLTKACMRDGIHLRSTSQMFNDGTSSSLIP